MKELHMDISPVGQLHGEPTSAPEGSSRLSGNLGVLHLFFTVMAFNAPLVVVIGLIPVVISNGNGLGAPITYIVCGVFLGLFAVGFTTMSRHLPNPGGFYAYITAGLGKAVGLGSSFIALVCYFFALLGSYGFSGLVLNSLIADTFGGPSIPWWVLAAVVFVVVSALGYFRIDVSAKFLAVFLALEVALVVVYDICVLARGGGPEGFSTSSFTVDSVFSGSTGLALMFGFGMFGGFEATAIFRDEVRNPTKTVPRATYAVIAFVALLYGVTTYMFIQGWGASKAVDASTADPAGSMLASMGTYGGHVLAQTATILVNTSAIAVLIAAHNITSRYMYNLGADGILPSALGAVHPRHGSPSRASLATSAIVAIGMVPFVLAGADPNTLYAVLLGVFSYALILLLFITAIAVPVYLHRHRHEIPQSTWKAVVAPAVAIIGLAIALVLSTLNFDILVGGSQAMADAMFVLVYGLFVAGVVLAAIYRRRRPDVYARIGRQQ